MPDATMRARRTTRRREGTKGGARRAAQAILAGIALGACSQAPSAATRSADAGVTRATDASREPGAVTLEAAQRWAGMCASCHGEAGEGGTGPSLVDTPSSVAALTEAIDARMPSGNPGACRGECASSLADFIKAQFTSERLACSAPPTSPRRLRLLTRREYRNTLRDLFGAGEATAGDCRVRTFAWSPGGRAARSVHLAGSFNAWSTSAWPMAFSAERARWELTRELVPGTYPYKFVLDGTDWIADPSNPDSAPDGFGGRNSVLTVRCDDGAGTVTAGARTFDPAASLPQESRPEGFPYDTAAETGLVTSVHVNEYLRAAQQLVDGLGEQLPRALGCADAPSCADALVGSFGTRVFRRPLTESERGRYRALAGSPAGLRAALRAMLVSPMFLYRSEMGVAQADGSYRLTGWEVAAALSYTFTATTPDAALLGAAERGELTGADGIEREARRLLASPRAREQVADFATQWFGVDEVTSTPRNATVYPGFDDGVRRALLEETRRFVTAVFFDGERRVDALFNADWTFANGALARWYGIDGVTGDAWQRATLPAHRRAGILAHGSVMTRTAHSDQTSPILRGLFVRRSLLCQEFPPPPPNAGGVPDVDPTATTRERFRQHTANAACATCHQHIDGVGFGFEEFDGVGRHRTMENGAPIDHAGLLDAPEGWGRGMDISFASLPELGAALARSPNARACVARQWFRFARGYRETALDRCAVRGVVRDFESRGGDLHAMMIATVRSPDFLTRR